MERDPREVREESVPGKTAKCRGLGWGIIMYLRAGKEASLLGPSGQLMDEKLQEPDHGGSLQGIVKIFVFILAGKPLESFEQKSNMI